MSEEKQIMVLRQVGNFIEDIQRENAALKEKLQSTTDMLKQCQEALVIIGDRKDVLKEKLKVAVEALKVLYRRKI